MTAHRTYRYLLAGLLAALVVAITAATPAAAATTRSYILFHEGPFGTQSLLCAIPIPAVGPAAAQQVNFTNDPYGCDNDEARSMTILNAAPGLVVEAWNTSVCANQVGHRRSDVSRIYLTGYATRTVVGSFEFSTGQVRGLPYVQTYQRSDGELDGKVSCVRIYRLA